MNLTAHEIETAINVIAQIGETDNERAHAICRAAGVLLTDAREKSIETATATAGVYLQPILDQALLRVAEMRGEFDPIELIRRIARERFELNLSWGDALIMVATYRTERPDALLFEYDIASDAIRWFFTTYAQTEILTDELERVQHGSNSSSTGA